MLIGEPGFECLLEEKGCELWIALIMSTLRISLNDKGVQKFEIALKKLCLNLAKQIVVDGEGAKKFLTINVINAKSLGSAKNIAFSIANSP